MQRPIIPQLDGPTFLLWEATQGQRFELHHGFVFDFAGGTADHDQLAFNLRTLLDRAVPAPCRTFGSDMKVRIANDSYYYADVTVTCELVSGQATVIEQPRIVVEVLSPKTRGFDLVEKRAAYRTLGSLEAYAIVYPEMRRVEVDRRGFGGNWQTETYDDDEAFIDGHRLTLDDIYARTSLADEAT